MGRPKQKIVPVSIADRSNNYSLHTCYVLFAFYFDEGVNVWEHTTCWAGTDPSLQAVVAVVATPMV